MDAKTRAEKIFAELFLDKEMTQAMEIAIQLLSSQISEAEKEAAKEAIQDKQKWMAMEPWIKEAREQGFKEGLEAEAEIYKHPIYCRGCNHCGEEGCCGEHNNCPSGIILEKTRNEALEDAANLCDKSILECGEFWVPGPHDIAKQIRALKSDGREGR